MVILEQKFKITKAIKKSSVMIKKMKSFTNVSLANYEKESNLIKSINQEALTLKRMTIIS